MHKRRCGIYSGCGICDRAVSIRTEQTASCSRHRDSHLDLKPQLKWIEADEKSHIFDVKIAAYLLNPLKNDYAYEDIAKDYLDLMVPSKEDYLGKKDLATASEEKPEEFLKNGMLSGIY